MYARIFYLNLVYGSRKKICRSLLYNEYTFNNVTIFVENKAAAIWSWTGFSKNSENLKKENLVKGNLVKRWVINTYNLKGTEYQVQFLSSTVPDLTFVETSPANEHLLDVPLFRTEKYQCIYFLVLTKGEQGDSNKAFYALFFEINVYA